MSKQSVSYRPNLKYTHNYQTSGSDIEQQSIKITIRRTPLDTITIPEIEDNFEYLDSALKAIPEDLAMALREVYNPVKDMFYEALIDKIIDPNAQKPEIIFKPTPLPTDTDNNNDNDNTDSGDDNDDINSDPSNDDLDDNESDNNNNNNNKIYPIVMHPIDYRTGEEIIPNHNDEDNIYPIILSPIGSNEDYDDDDNNDNIIAPYPIILHPIYDDIGKSDNTDSDYDESYSDDDNYPGYKDPIDSEPGLWEESGPAVEYVYPDLENAIDKEFVYILSKLLRHYTDSLKDVLNNYFFNNMRYNLNQSEENMNFINNNLSLTSNDILKHSKHLLDVSVKDENTAALKTEFFKNIFNIRNTMTHIRSFFIANELRKRYTGINYSKGNSMTNSMSDAFLKELNGKYELQYRSTFENLFRYLDSSLKITNDIIGLHIQNGLSKSTIIKKGGIK